MQSSVSSYWNWYAWMVDSLKFGLDEKHYVIFGILFGFREKSIDVSLSSIIPSWERDPSVIMFNHHECSFSFVAWLACSLLWGIPYKRQTKQTHQRQQKKTALPRHNTTTKDSRSYKNVGRCVQLKQIYQLLKVFAIF